MEQSRQQVAGSTAPPLNLGQVADIWTSAAAAAAAPASTSSAPRLVITHDCKNPACSRPGWPCEQMHVKEQYLENEPLRAKCGAPLCVRVQGADLTAWTQDWQRQHGPNKSLQLNVSLLGAEMYNDRLPGESLVRCTLLDQGRVPLRHAWQERKGAGGDAGQGESFVPVRLENCMCNLSNIVVTRSTKVLLKGYKDRRVHLLVEWPSPDGPSTAPDADLSAAPLPPTLVPAPAISPAFEVTTVRNKQNQKPVRPREGDPVSSLKRMGKLLGAKLQALADEVEKLQEQGKLLPAHMGGLSAPLLRQQGLGCIATAGQLKALLTELMARGQQDQLRALLNVRNVEHWDELVEHAMLVGTTPDSAPVTKAKAMPERVPPPQQQQQQRQVAPLVLSLPAATQPARFPAHLPICMPPAPASLDDGASPPTSEQEEEPDEEPAASVQPPVAIYSSSLTAAGPAAPLRKEHPPSSGGSGVVLRLGGAGSSSQPAQPSQRAGGAPGSAPASASGSAGVKRPAAVRNASDVPPPRRAVPAPAVPAELPFQPAAKRPCREPAPEAPDADDDGQPAQVVSYLQMPAVGGMAATVDCLAPGQMVTMNGQLYQVMQTGQQTMLVPMNMQMAWAPVGAQFGYAPQQSSLPTVVLGMPPQGPA